jgi:hypothetical protein
MSTATNPLPYGGGLTKRELFAAMALQGILTREPNGRLNVDDAVKQAIELGDRLAAALGDAR